MSVALSDDRAFEAERASQVAALMLLDDDLWVGHARLASSETIVEGEDKSAPPASSSTNGARQTQSSAAMTRMR